MGFKSLFIKPTPKDEPEETTVAQNAQPAPVPYQPVQYQPQPQYVPTSVQPNSEDFSVFMEQLLEGLEAANLPNVQDYMDLRKALENMEGMGMDESMKFKAVFATLQASGCDIKALLESFDYYKNILDAEKQKFDEAIASATSEAVLEKQQTIERLTQENAQKTADIQRLSQEINANQQQMTALQVEVSTANTKIEQKKSNFMAAYKTISDTMAADREKVKLYISAVPTQKVKKTSKK